MADVADLSETMQDKKQTELDRLLNDPDVPMQPGRVWDLLDQLAAPIAGDLVGARGFEPPASCSQSRRTTRLYYTPTSLI